jgi:hypothetical protein
MFRLGANLGTVNVLLDGNPVATGLDLSNGAATSLATGVTTSIVTGAFYPGYYYSGSVCTLTFQNVPLDLHTVAIYYASASVAGGVSIIFPQLTFAY